MSECVLKNCPPCDICGLRDGAFIVMDEADGLSLCGQCIEGYRRRRKEPWWLVTENNAMGSARVEVWAGDGYARREVTGFPTRDELRTVFGKLIDQAKATPTPALPPIEMD